MVRAVEKLRESFSKPLRIEDVARELGYDDASHFNREYKRHFGQPPDARRRTTARARDGVYPGSAPPLLQQRLRVVIVWIELERALGGAHRVFSLAGLVVDVLARSDTDSIRHTGTRAARTRADQYSGSGSESAGCEGSEHPWRSSPAKITDQACPTSLARPSTGRTDRACTPETRFR